MKKHLCREKGRECAVNNDERSGAKFRVGDFVRFNVKGDLVAENVAVGVLPIDVRRKIQLDVIGIVTKVYRRNEASLNKSAHTDKLVGCFPYVYDVMFDTLGVRGPFIERDLTLAQNP